MFRCQHTTFRQFTVVLAKVMDCQNDKIQYMDPVAQSV
jgi:hypothetical protein